MNQKDWIELLDRAIEAGKELNRQLDELEVTLHNLKQAKIISKENDNHEKEC